MEMTAYGDQANRKAAHTMRETWSEKHMREFEPESTSYLLVDNGNS